MIVEKKIGALLVRIAEYGSATSPVCTRCYLRPPPPRRLNHGPNASLSAAILRLTKLTNLPARTIDAPAGPLTAMSLVPFYTSHALAVNRRMRPAQSLTNDLGIGKVALDQGGGRGQGRKESGREVVEHADCVSAPKQRLAKM